MPEEGHGLQCSLGELHCWAQLQVAVQQSVVLRAQALLAGVASWHQYLGEAEALVLGGLLQNHWIVAEAFEHQVSLGVLALEVLPAGPLPAAAAYERAAH